MTQDAEPKAEPKKERGNVDRGVGNDERLMIVAVEKTFRHNGEVSFRGRREVGREMGLSANAVTALLNKAFHRGLFRTILRWPVEETEVPRLEDAVKTAYGLRGVHLVPGAADMLQDLGRPRLRSIHKQITMDLARRAAEFLDLRLAEEAARVRELIRGGATPDAFRMGVAWGRTLHEIAKALLSKKRSVFMPTLKVLPIVGVSCALASAGVEANVVAMDMARAYAGRAGQLPCPAVVDGLDASMASRLRQVRDVLAEIGRCRLVLTGMGPVVDTGNDEEMRVSNDPQANTELAKAARQAGAIGEICYWLFNTSGHEVKTEHEALGLGFDGLRRIAADPRRDVVLVTGGDKRRIEPLRVALNAKLASILISDTVTARFLVGEA